MPENEIIVGLDVGTTKICALVGEVDASGGVQILGVGQSVSEGLRKGVVIDLDAAHRNIRSAVDEASRATGVEINAVVVGVTGEHVTSVTSRGTVTITHASREITEADVNRALDNARSVTVPVGREIIHILPRGFVVDGQDGVRQPVGMSGGKLEVEAHVVTGSSSFIQNVLKSVTLAGLHVDSVVLEPIATSEAVLSDAEKEMGVIVADIGGGTTDLAVVINGSIIHSAVIPVGGNHVTGDLAVGLKTTRDEAERLKKDFGCALVSMVSDNDLVEVRTLDGDRSRSVLRVALADIIEPRMQELFHLIRDDLGRHGYQHALSSLVLSGGGSLLHGAPELAHAVLGLPTRIGRPRNLVGQVEGIDSPIFATAVGLLYFGAARQVRVKEQTSTRRFLGSALEQLRQWLLRFFGG